MPSPGSVRLLSLRFTMETPHADTLSISIHPAIRHKNNEGEQENTAVFDTSHWNSSISRHIYITLFSFTSASPWPTKWICVVSDATLQARRDAYPTHYNRRLCLLRIFGSARININQLVCTSCLDIYGSIVVVVKTNWRSSPLMNSQPAMIRSFRDDTTDIGKEQSIVNKLDIGH